jgi:hypothetical protein
LREPIREDDAAQAQRKGSADVLLDNLVRRKSQVRQMALQVVFADVFGPLVLLPPPAFGFGTPDTFLPSIGVAFP